MKEEITLLECVEDLRRKVLKNAIRLNEAEKKIKNLDDENSRLKKSIKTIFDYIGT